MKQVALCVGLALALGVITGSMIMWGILPALNCAAAGALAVWVAHRGAVRRDRMVRQLLVAAYQADAPPRGSEDLVRLLGTPDVVKARSDYLRREDVRWAQMQANGEASGR
jgi:hypothetical protein